MKLLNNVTHIIRQLVLALTICTHIAHGLFSERVVNSYKNGHGVSKLVFRRYSSKILATTASYDQVENDIRRYIRQKKWANAIDSSSKWTPPSSNLTRTATYVIVETCRRSNSPHQILELLHQLPEGHFTYTREDDVMPYLSDLGGYSNCTKEKGQRARELVSYLAARGVQFSAKTFSVLLKKCVSDYDDIQSTLELCLNSNVSIDVILLNSAMDAYIRVDRFDKAVRLFEIATSRIAAPPLPARLLDSFVDKDLIANQSASPDSNASAYQADASERFGRLMESSSDVCANVRTVNTLMKGLRSKLDVGFDISLKLLRWMISNHAAGDNSVKPDTITINTLVDAAILAGRLSLAENLLTRPLLLDVQPGVEAYTSLIRAHANEGEGEAGVRIYNLALSRGIQPNSLTESAYISALISSRKLYTARQILLQKVEEFESNTGTETSSSLKLLFSSYVLAIGKLFDQVDDSALREKLLDESERALVYMDRLFIPPDVRALNSFMSCLGESGRPHKLQEMITLFWLMVENGINPDEFTFNPLFSALGKSGAVNALVRFLELVKSTNSARFADVLTVNSFMRGLVSSNRPLDAIDAYYRLFRAIPPGQESDSVVSMSGSTSFQPTKVTFTILFLAIVSNLRQQDKSNMDLANARNQITASADPPTTLLFSEADGRFYERSENAEVQLDSMNNPVEIDSEFSFLATETTSPTLPLLSYTNGSVPVAAIEICSFLNPVKNVESEKSSSYQDSPDVLLKRLYREMRFRLLVDPDEFTFTVLKTLFAVNSKLPRSVISREAAILVFEDLVVLNFNPSQVKYIVFLEILHDISFLFI